MEKATHQDAMLLIEYGKLGTNRGVHEAMNWLLSDAFVPDYQELLKKHPPGSKEFGIMRTIAIHYEGLGTLLKHGLVNEDLLFDWFLAPWGRMQAFVLGERERFKEPRLGENFELLGQRQEAWQEAHKP